MSFDLRAFLRSRFSREGAVGLYLTVGLLVCVLLACLFASLADEVFEPGGLTALDREVMNLVHGYQTSERTALARAVTALGDFHLLIPATIGSAIVLWIRGRHVAAILFAGAVLEGWLLDFVLKILFHRSRPDLWPALVTQGTPSFPSGHATMATLFWGGFVAVIFHIDRRRRVRMVALLTAISLILAVSATRVYLGAHWVTDVVAGMFLGLFWVTVCATGTEYLARRRTAANR